MTRYLQLSFIKSALSRGRSVEQLLHPGSVKGERTVRWLEIAPVPDGTIELRLLEALDAGGPTWLDLYDFPVTSPDGALTVHRHGFASIEEALQASVQTYGASAERFVNFGVIQDEYRDSLESR